MAYNNSNDAYEIYRSAAESDDENDDDLPLSTTLKSSRRSQLAYLLVPAVLVGLIAVPMLGSWLLVGRRQEGAE